jgi:hypothetical protein
VRITRTWRRETGGRLVGRASSRRVGEGDEGDEGRRGKGEKKKRRRRKRTKEWKMKRKEGKRE